MLISLVSPAILLALAVRIVRADTVQDDWVFPQSPDYATTLTLGEKYTLEWTSGLQNWFSYYCSDCDINKVDLWVTGDGDRKHKIASDVDVANTLSISWTAIVPTDELPDGRPWVLRFVPRGTGVGGQEISSNGFYIKQSASMTSSSTSEVTTSTTPPNTFTSTTTQSSSAVGSSNSPTGSPHSKPSPGLSTAASAGIGVGAGIGALLLLTFGYFLARWTKSKKEGSSPSELETRHVGNPPPSYAPNNLAYNQHPSPDAYASQQPYSPQPYTGEYYAPMDPAKGYAPLPQASPMELPAHSERAELGDGGQRF